MGGCVCASTCHTDEAGSLMFQVVHPFVLTYLDVCLGGGIL